MTENKKRKKLPPRVKPRRKPGKPDQGPGTATGGGRHKKEDPKKA